ncbi:low molecular weight protein arginine phosphatase [Desulfosporosinus sp. Sb-LF]|nr:low molecular weight protein arginine phosphatase [Desulfosporosinus sp. Sb-LF]
MKLLFICTGNTCRSPMAEGLARAMFGNTIQVSSAGMEAWEGKNASPHALDILKEQNVDISNHRARRINDELMADADWIIPMTQAQEEALKRFFPRHVHKIRCLGDWGNQKQDVRDPWGGSIEIYRQTAQEINELIKVLKSQFPNV